MEMPPAGLPPLGIEPNDDKPSQPSPSDDNSDLRASSAAGTKIAIGIGISGGIIVLAILIILSISLNFCGWALIKKLLNHSSKLDRFCLPSHSSYLAKKAKSHEEPLKAAKDQWADRYLYQNSDRPQTGLCVEMQLLTPCTGAKCPPPPPTSFDDAEWDHIDWHSLSWDVLEGDAVIGSIEEWAVSAFFTPPESPISQDLASTPVEQARAKFQQDFPHGVQRMSTPGTGQLCGLFAVQLSMNNQPDFRDMRQPTIKELEAIWREFQDSSPAGNENSSLFELYQLARIVQTYLEQQGAASQLGAVAPSGGVKMFPMIVSDFDHLKDAGRVLWVYNDGARDDQDGTHWEGLRSEGLDDSVDIKGYWETMMGPPSVASRSFHGLSSPPSSNTYSGSTLGAVGMNPWKDSFAHG